MSITLMPRLTTARFGGSATPEQNRDPTQVYAQIQPAQLKASVSFYEARALDALTT
jgi:hypothetical protein